MKRKLLVQMCNEWRMNLWMIIELLIVSVVLFVLTDKLYTTVATLTEPLGFNSDHCYLLDVTTISEASPDYVKYASDEESVSDLLKLMDRIKVRPEITAAAISRNSHPYNLNNSYIQVDIDTISMADSPLLERNVEPDFFKVFQIEGASGETPVQLASILMRDKFILSDNALDVKAGEKSLKPLYGKMVVMRNNDDTLTLRSSAKPMRYSRYSSAYEKEGRSVFTLMTPWMYPYANEVTVRVADNMDDNFARNLMKDADGHLRVGNWYIASVRSFDFIRENSDRAARTDVRNVVVCALFLLVNIFLGILGTFWFRTRRRLKEISLRMACGATRGDVFRRIFAEGELLLLCVTPVAAAIDFLLVRQELVTWYNGYFHPVRFTACVMISWLLMAIMIAAGIYFPGRRAMRVQPAVALRSE